MRQFRYCLFKRRGSANWWIRRTVPGLGEMRLSSGTADRGVAEKLDRLVFDLRESGRHDALAALKRGTVSIHELDSHRDAVRLSELLNRTASPRLLPLVTEWFDLGPDDMGIRESSMRRYRASWRHVWDVLSPNARVSDINQDFVTAFKRHRKATAKRRGREIAGATLNRDMAAIGAFLRWCAEEKGVAVVRPKLKYQQESSGRTRWLTSDELAAFRQNCPREWWPLFGLLFGTGITISEALGLRTCDVDLREGRVSIHERHGRKLKRRSRARDLALPQSLIPDLDAFIRRNVRAPMDLLFGMTYWPARSAWTRICKAAGIVSASLHDARHTFAVHATLNGVPEARLQRLLGHAHPGTTRRYATFAPGQFVREDVESVSQSQGLEKARLLLESAV